MFITSTINGIPQFDWQPAYTTRRHHCSTYFDPEEEGSMLPLNAVVHLQHYTIKTRKSAPLKQKSNQHVHSLRHPYASLLPRNTSVHEQSRWVTCSPRCESLSRCNGATLCWLTRIVTVNHLKHRRRQMQVPSCLLSERCILPTQSINAFRLIVAKNIFFFFPEQ